MAQVTYHGPPEATDEINRGTETWFGNCRGVLSLRRRRGLRGAGGGAHAVDGMALEHRGGGEFQ